MNESISKALGLITTNKKLVIVLVFATLAATWMLVNAKSSENKEAIAETPSLQKFAIETVGEETSEGFSSSWSGELISPNDIPVYPQREGSLISWNVKIGQQVKAGQVLATLSAPPANADQIGMLASASENLARAKARAEAQVVFATKNKQQLLDLKLQIEKSATAKKQSLSEDPASSKNIVLTSLESARDAARKNVDTAQAELDSVSKEAIRKIVPLFSTTTSDPIAYYQQYPSSFRIPLRSSISVSDYSVLTKYETGLYASVKAAASEDPTLGEKTLSWLRVTQNLASVIVIVDDDSISPKKLQEKTDEMRIQVSMSVSNLTMAKTELAKMESELASRKSEYTLALPEADRDLAEKLKDINEKIIDLDREESMALAESKAAGAAYATIQKATLGNLTIIAPRNGIVGSINKNIGEFVKPEDAVASVNGGSQEDLLVRFRVPLGSTPPEVGSELFITRPGFQADKKKIKVTGVGVSMGENGYFVAEGTVVDSVNWPARSQVRVESGRTQTILVPIEAIQFSETGKPFLWTVEHGMHAHKQEVKTGKTIAGNIEILDGLKVGDQYIPKPDAKITEGMELSKMQTPSESLPEANPNMDGHNHEH